MYLVVVVAVGIRFPVSQHAYEEAFLCCVCLMAEHSHKTQVGRKQQLEKKLSPLFCNTPVQKTEEDTLDNTLD